jgi:hypothetical protein
VGAQFIRRRSTKKGRGNLFARTSKIFLGKKGEGDVNGVGEEQNEDRAVTSPTSEPISEQPEYETANAPTLPTEPVGGTTEQVNIAQPEHETTNASTSPTEYGRATEQVDIAQPEHETTNASTLPTEYGRATEQVNISQPKHETANALTSPTEYGRATEQVNIAQPEHETANALTSPTEYGRATEQVDIAQPSEGPGISEATEDQIPNGAPTSPKSGSKLGIWFRRRFSKPPTPEKEIKSDVNGRQEVPTMSQEVPASVAIGSPRAAPLASNPVTDTDFASTAAPNAALQPQLHEDNVEEKEDDDEIGNEEVARQWSSSTEHSKDRDKRWSTSPASSQQDGTRRRGLRMSLRDMIARKPSSEQGSAAASPLASPTMATSSVGKNAASPRPDPVPRMNTMERNELRDSFTEESLPPPPAVLKDTSRRSVSSSARDSKFSEDI